MLGYLLLPKESTWRSTSKPHPSESDDHNSINCLLYFITYLYTLFLFQKSLNVQKIEILMKFFILSYFSINPTQPGILPIFYVIFEFVYQQIRYIISNIQSNVIQYKTGVRICITKASQFHLETYSISKYNSIFTFQFISKYMIIF